MNASIYLFGEFNSGYSQYPDDYASSIFQKFSANAKSITQIAIHRDGNLVYYGYIRRLQQDRYIGLCVVLNGLLLTRIDGLFSLFENVISGLVTKGLLIHFNEQGDIVTNVEKLYMNKEEIDLLTESLRVAFSNFETSMVPLPAVRYGVTKDSVKDFVVGDDLQEIIKSSYTNGYTYVYKSRWYNTGSLNSYKGVLSRISKEKKDIAQELEKLRREHAKTLRQKKQIQYVILLAVIVCVLFAILWNKVLFPSEVTHYETGEFVYYGPIKDSKPHGTGVAIYPLDDANGRRYYIGNFEYGNRQDSTAILFYQHGDYYYGSMNGDRWNYGRVYKKSDDTYFEGTFDENCMPFNGTWYGHVKLYDVVDGIKTVNED